MIRWNCYRFRDSTWLDETCGIFLVFSKWFVFDQYFANDILGVFTDVFFILFADFCVGDGMSRRAKDMGQKADLTITRRCACTSSNFS